MSSSKHQHITASNAAQIAAQWGEMTEGAVTWVEARSALAAKLSLHPDTITRMRKRLAALGYEPWQEADNQQINTSVSGDTFDVDVPASKARTIEEVIELCKVDSSVWESKGFNVRRGNKGFAWSARFARKAVSTTTTEAMLESFAQKAAKHAPSFARVKPIKTPTSGRLLELSIPDLHLAKLCWAQETGHRDYDIKIAVDLYRKAVASILQSAEGMGVSRILLPIGNDLLNSDNAAGTTTAGTPQAQSEDSRWKKAFMTACDLIVETVESLASQYPVDVLVVAGNHDNERCFYLGQYVKSWFRSHPNVTVDNTPTQRKYYRFGATLLGFTHGNEEKSARLPGIMANERRALWAETQYHEWHLGHEHRAMLHEELGVKIRHLPSLCPPDEWMASKGYIGNDQAAEGFVFDLEKGMVASLYFRA